MQGHLFRCSPIPMPMHSHLCSLVSSTLGGAVGSQQEIYSAIIAQILYLGPQLQNGTNYCAVGTKVHDLVEICSISHLLVLKDLGHV